MLNLEDRYMEKILVTDVDGTLTDDSKTIMPESVEAIKLAKKHGFRVFIATGNPYSVAWTLSFFLGARDWVIAESGGVIGNSWDNYVILGDREEIKRGLQFLLDHFPSDIQISPTNKFRLIDLAFYSKLPAGLFQELLDKHGYSLDVKDSGYAKHVITKGVSKASSLNEIIKREKIDEKELFLAVIGDGDNDLDLFTFPLVSIRGTLQNATDLIKKHAERVSPHSFGKGVLEFVEYLIEQ